MKKSILFALVFTSIFAFAQEKPAPLHLDPDAPAWMQLLQTDNPNVFEVQHAYRDFYRENIFEKNRYTQFYKRWMHWARPFTQADGSLHVPTPEEDAIFEKKILAQRAENQSTGERGAGAGSWSFIGPKSTWDINGTTPVTWQTNIYSLDISLSNPNILVAGGESGGLWRTTDKGLNWTLLTLNTKHGAFGAVKIHPTNPSVIWTGTGGKIIKSTDAGATWTTVFSENNLWVNAFSVSTANPDHILAAAETGLLRSTNGGQNWTKLFTNLTWSVVHKPGDPTTVFAIRKNGSGADFLKSTDSGASWTPSNTGLWVPTSGRSITGGIVAVCPSQPEKLYAYFCGNGTDLYGYVGVFVSNNGGTTWANTHPTNAIGNAPTIYSIPAHTNLMAHNGTTGFDQGFYDMAIIVNPTNANQLIAGGTSWFRSNDGGRTWSALGSYVGGLPWSHPDMQALAVHGSDLWIATDGGLNYSNNWASSIEPRMNGISGSDMWGFGSGWNEDLLVGGRYHNGNMAWFEQFPEGKFYRMGGAEAATGYVSPGPERKVYHSDIGGHVIRGGFTQGVAGFSVGAWPNESYAYFANSEMEWHPNCWNVIFLGKDQKLWKSTDGGTTFTAIYTFPGTEDNTVFDIEISRKNPSVMYCSQWDGSDDAIWRSSDSGANWLKCKALPTPNNNDRVKLALSDSDPNVLWAAVTYGSNGRKIYKTTDGGQSWQNLTTAKLDGIRIANVMAQYGTDGGIYLGTNAGVFYRNNTHADWQFYSENLPVSAETNRLKPFYKTGKIRNGCWGFGVWEAPLFEPSKSQALAMADKLSSECNRDTFYFDDFSAVNHASASWRWQFPGAAWVSDSTDRNPKVFFGKSGSFKAIMRLNDGGSITYDTLDIQIGSACDRDSLPGQALQLDGTTGYAAANRNLNLNSSNFTVTAWVKPQGTQEDWAGLVFWRGGSTTAGMSLRSNNELRYHWNDQGWSWSSGLIVPSDRWSHVALVAEPNKLTLYLDGVAATHTTTISTEEFNTPLHLGLDPNGGGRNFRGLLDEVCVYNRALTQSEIRENMHLVRSGASLAGLVSYYQFNENTTAPQALDRAGNAHLGLGGAATRTASTVAVGPGRSHRRDAFDVKRNPFKNADFLMVMSPGAPLPKGEMVVTRLGIGPGTPPATDPAMPFYWVLRYWGGTPNFTQPAEVWFEKIGDLPPDLAPGSVQLWKRGIADEGQTWTATAGSKKIVGPNGSVAFGVGNQVNSSGQFYLTNPAFYKNPPSSEPVFDRSETQFSTAVFPNPVSGKGQLTVQTGQPGESVFRLFDSQGRAVRMLKFSGKGSLDLGGLEAGLYFYRIENERFMKVGSVEVF